MDEDKGICPTCQGTGECFTCRGGSINEPGLSCDCEATHVCVDCLGKGTHWAYAAIQMERLDAVLRQSGLQF